MVEWTEGVCGDGAAILRDGAMVPIEEVVERLNEAERQAQELADLQDGRTAVIPKTREHAQHLLLVAEACYHGNATIMGFATKPEQQ